MRDLTPTVIFEQYQQKKIDKATAIKQLQIFVENSDAFVFSQDGIRKIPISRRDALNFLGEMAPITEELFPFFEQVLISDLNAEMRAIAAKIIVNIYLERGRATIEYVCQNPGSFFVIKNILEASKKVDPQYYTNIRDQLINRYSSSYEVFPNEAEFFLDLDFERFRKWGEDFEPYPKINEYGCGSFSKLKNIIDYGSDLPTFYSAYNFHVSGLDFRGWGILNIPDSIINLRELKYLNLGNTHLKKLPDSLEPLSKLRVLNLEETKLSSIPKWIYTLAKKRYSQKYQREGVQKPEAAVLGALETLTGCLIKYTNLEEEVDGDAHGYMIDNTGHVIWICLSYEAKVTSLPDEIVKLTYLEELYLSGLKIENLSARVKKFLANLKGFESYNAHEKNLSLINLRKYKYLRI